MTPPLRAGSGGSFRAAPESAPAVVFVVIGLIVAALIVWILAHWVAGPDFRPAPLGADRPTPVLLAVIRGVEVFACLMCAGWLWFVVVRPWRRDGSMSWDGMLTFACLSMWIQDPMCNYFNFTFAYNDYFTNFGSWSASIPGWQSPRGGNLPEPLLLIGGVYFWFSTLNVIAFGWALKKLQRWLPRVSILGLAPLAFVVLVLFDLLLQIPATRLGLFAYPGSVEALTIWAGEPFQFPIYGDLLINMVFMTLGLLRHYRDDRGMSFVERGFAGAAGRSGLQRGARVLALIGACNLSYFCLYFLPYAWLAMSADAFPRYPSYMLSEICGRGTPYACPSRYVPVPSRTTRAVVAPSDPRLPPDSRRN